MRIIYLSPSVPAHIYNRHKLKHSPPAQKFNNLVIEGLRLNGCEVLTVGLFIGGLKDRLVVEEFEGVKYHIFSDGGLLHRLRCLREFWARALADRQDTVVVSDYLGYLNNLFFIIINIRLRLRCCAIVTDLPEYLGFGSRKRLRKYIFSLIGKVILKCFSCHIVLTKAIASKIRSKHYRVIEGLVPSHADQEYRPIRYSQRKKQIIYAGSLHKEFGITELIGAFVKADLKDYDLCIYGDGNYRHEVEDICKSNNQIKYLGVRPMAEVEKAERCAMLLVNPRDNTREFTKYSFPSKNMEYMLSGTPMIAHKLSGIPDEYLEHMYIFSSTDTDDMAVDIKNVINKSPDELESMAKRARKFVLSEKNSKVQSKKIIDLINSL